MRTLCHVATVFDFPKGEHRLETCVYESWRQHGFKGSRNGHGIRAISRMASKDAGRIHISAMDEWFNRKHGMSVRSYTTSSVAWDLTVSGSPCPNTDQKR